MYTCTAYIIHVKDSGNNRYHYIWGYVICDLIIAYVQEPKIVTALRKARTVHMSLIDLFVDGTAALNDSLGHIEAGYLHISKVVCMCERMR